MSTTMDDDLELLARWREGDRAAGNRLFKRHFDVVARFFRNKVRGGDADLIQRTFLDAMKAEANFRGEGTFRGFLVGIAANVLRHHYRSKSRHDDRIDFGTVSASDLHPGPSTMVAKRAEERLLLEGLRRLPLELQMVLELYFWEDMTAAEIAQIIRAPIGTIRTRIRRAKQLLHAALAQLCESPQQLDTTTSDLEVWAKGLRAVASEQAKKRP